MGRDDAGGKQYVNRSVHPNQSRNPRRAGELPRLPNDAI